ncbi:hypothetical protein BD779DRAFT_1561993, partial [Infundibulicybe gibba]
MPTDLPPELLRIIFLHMAKLSTPACCTLCAVSSWVRHLALPVLYRTVFIRHTRHLSAFEKSITHPLACPPSPSFDPADAVRHLWVPFASKTLAPLVVHRNRQDPHTRAGAHAGKGDLHIVLLRDHLRSHISGIHSLYRRVTHLRLDGPVKPEVWQAIGAMANLTHLAVPGDIEQGSAWIFDLVEDTSIEVFVLVLQDGRKHPEIENWVRNLRKENEWIYAVWTVWQWRGLELEWDAEVRGGTTIWEMAVKQTQQLMSWDFGDPMGWTRLRWKHE